MMSLQEAVEQEMKKEGVELPSKSIGRKFAEYHARNQETLYDIVTVIGRSANNFVISFEDLDNLHQPEIILDMFLVARECINSYFDQNGKTSEYEMAFLEYDTWQEKVSKVLKPILPNGITRLYSPLP